MFQHPHRFTFGAQISRIGETIRCFDIKNKKFAECGFSVGAPTVVREVSRCKISSQSVPIFRSYSCESHFIRPQYRAFRHIKTQSAGRPRDTPIVKFKLYKAVTATSDLNDSTVYCKKAKLETEMMNTVYLFNWLDKSINSFQHVFNMSRISSDRLQLRTKYVVELLNHLTFHSQYTHRPIYSIHCLVKFRCSVKRDT